MFGFIFSYFSDIFDCSSDNPDYDDGNSEPAKVRKKSADDYNPEGNDKNTI